MKNSSQKQKRSKDINSVYDATARALSDNKISSINQSGIKIRDNISNNIIIFNSDNKDIEYFSRGIVDFASLSLRFTNNKVFKKYLPEDKYEIEVFKIINAARSIAIGTEKFIGCKLNLDKIIDNSDLLFDKANDKSLLKSYSLIFKYFLKNFSNKKNKYSSSFAKKFPKLPLNSLSELNNQIYDQKKFFESVLKFIKFFNLNDKKEEKKEFKDESDLQKDSQKLEKKQKKNPEENQLIIEELLSRKKTRDLSEIDETNQNNVLNKINIKNSKYDVFTKKFDLAIDARKLALNNELIQLRKKLDEEFSDDEMIVIKLAKKLEKLLYSLNQNYWLFDQDEGFFDNSRFSNFVANPDNSSIFKIIDNSFSKNTVVTLLLDNSGSMRGKPIITAVKTAEIIARVLEKCNVRVEILGFTTKEWKGGSSKLEWEKSGKPEKPGRLNDLLHIIYKASNASWRSSRNNLALVLKEGLLKENIDGEALLWANKRLKSKVEKKKILIIISDGAPVDDSTLSANNSNILDDHLKKVVQNIERDKSLKLLAIGIGHDVSKYYRNAFTIDDVNKLAEVLIDKLVSIIKEVQSI